jgi:hypothetical protein
MNGFELIKTNFRQDLQDEQDFVTVSCHRPTGPMARREETVKITAYRRTASHFKSKE